jgi:hypothetical protein
MDKAVAMLAKAVTTTAAVGFLLSVVIIVATGTLFALPLLILNLVAGIYAWQVAHASRTVAAAEPELKQRILVA